LSILPRISLLVLALALAACSPEQSRNIGAQPKKTVDKVTVDVNKSMQQGSDRLKEQDSK
jgi:uncharacterized OsmC-like protein